MHSASFDWRIPLKRPSRRLRAAGWTWSSAVGKYQSAAAISTLSVPTPFTPPSRRSPTCASGTLTGAPVKINVARTNFPIAGNERNELCGRDNHESRAGRLLFSDCSDKGKSRPAPASACGRLGAHVRQGRLRRASFIKSQGPPAGRSSGARRRVKSNPTHHPQMHS